MLPGLIVRFGVPLVRGRRGRGDWDVARGLGHRARGAAREAPPLLLVPTAERGGGPPGPVGGPSGRAGPDADAPLERRRGRWPGSCGHASRGGRRPRSGRGRRRRRRSRRRRRHLRDKAAGRNFRLETMRLGGGRAGRRWALRSPVRGCEVLEGSARGVAAVALVRACGRATRSRRVMCASTGARWASFYPGLPTRSISANHSTREFRGSAVDRPLVRKPESQAARSEQFAVWRPFPFRISHFLGQSVGRAPQNGTLGIGSGAQRRGERESPWRATGRPRPSSTPRGRC